MISLLPDVQGNILEKTPGASNKKALIIDSSQLDRIILNRILCDLSYQTLILEDGYSALDSFKNFSPDIIFMNLNLPGLSSFEVTRQIKSIINDKGVYIPIIYVTSLNDVQVLSEALEAGGDDFLIKPINVPLLKAKVNTLLRTKSLHDSLRADKKEMKRYIDSQNKDLDDAKSIFDQMQMPRFENPGNLHWVYMAQSILSGDVFYSAINPSGEHIILVGDNTGHGLPAAISSVISSEIFYSMVDKGIAIQVIIEELNRKLLHLLPVDRFLATCIMSINSDYTEMEVWNAGFPSILIVSKEGELKEKIVSMDMALGIKHISDKDVMPIRLDLNQGDRIYAYSDGVIETFNEDGEMYGEERFINSIIKNQGVDDRVYKIVNESLYHQEKNELNDDLLLLEINCNNQQIKHKKRVEKDTFKIPPMPWKTRFEFGKESICHTNPVPIVIEAMKNIQGFGEHRATIFLMLTEMYLNALEHGILNLESSMKEEDEGFKKYYELKEKRLQELEQASIAIEVEQSVEDDKGILIITIEDSGKGFDYQNKNQDLSRNTASSGRGVGLLQMLCRKCEYSEAGRRLRVEYEWQY